MTTRVTEQRLDTASNWLTDNPLVFGGNKGGYRIQRSSNIGFGLLKLGAVATLIGYPLKKVYYDKVETPWKDILKMNLALLAIISVADYQARCATVVLPPATA